MAATPRRGLDENFAFIGDGQVERFENFTLGINTADLTTLDTVESLNRNASLAGKFGFAHHQVFPMFLHIVGSLHITRIAH